MTARSQVRSARAARTLASSTVSPSRPPAAGRRLTAAFTYGIGVRSTHSAPARTFPALPPPVQYSRSRRVAPSGGTRPWLRSEPSASRTDGPSSTAPAVWSSRKSGSSGLLPAKSGTLCHSCQPWSEETSSTGASAVSSAGRRARPKRWPADPSASPRISPSTRSAWIAVAVPPTQAADRRDSTGLRL